MNDQIGLTDIHVFAYAVLSGLGIALAFAFIAWVIFAADWFVADFEESEIEAEPEVEARLQEEIA